MANQRAGKHIITTAIEHASVAAVVSFLEEQGFEVTILPVDENGQISLEELEAAIREDTILVSMMQINNEMGAIEPIAEAGALIQKRIRTPCFMWMRSSPTENCGSIRKNECGHAFCQWT